MARRMPSLTALLALVAVAGYQNRDKIGSFIKKMSEEGGIVDQARKNLSEKAQQNAEGTSVKSGLEEMLDQFKHNGEEDKASSWVGSGPNKSVNEPTLQKALGPEILDQIAKATGLTRDEILKRLAQVLPDTVDQMTPEGRIPT